MEITLSVDKAKVMGEVSKTAEYTGQKKEGDDNAYERMSITDEDKVHLERFWEECRADLCQEFIGIVSDERISGSNYTISLDVSKSFDASLKASMEISLFSYFVHGIAAKWYVYTNKEEAGAYADKAATMLEDIHRKAVFKKRPVRPTYND